MLTPAQYAARYWNLGVYLDSGPVSVRIDRYHLGAPTGAKDQLWQALREHFRSHRQDPAYRLQLRLNNAEAAEFANENQLRTHLVRPFYGKGSPEDCQIVLQLAVLLGRTTTAHLQSYANDNLGLDCNGFVGNYLFHEQAGHRWNTEPGRGQVGPSSLITEISRLGRPVASLDAMPPTSIYILAQVDAHGSVMPGGPRNPPGHIVITEPNRFMPQSFVTDSFGGLDYRLSTMGAYGNPAYWAVESTGGNGLTESWYVFPRDRFNRGICQVFRSSKGKTLKFKITQLT